MRIYFEDIKNTEDTTFLKVFFIKYIIFSLREAKQNCFRNTKKLQNCSLINKEIHPCTRNFDAR